MPMPPKLGRVVCKVGHSKVLRKLKSEEFTTASGNVRVARKVAVNLNGKRINTDESGKVSGISSSAKDLVSDHSEVVGNDCFLEQPPNDQLKTLNLLRPAKHRLSTCLAQEF